MPEEAREQILQEETSEGCACDWHLIVEGRIHGSYQSQRELEEAASAVANSEDFWGQNLIAVHGRLYSVQVAITHLVRLDMEEGPEMSEIEWRKRVREQEAAAAKATAEESETQQEASTKDETPAPQAPPEEPTESAAPKAAKSGTGRKKGTSKKEAES